MGGDCGHAVSAPPDTLCAARPENGKSRSSRATSPVVDTTCQTGRARARRHGHGDSVGRRHYFVPRLSWRSDNLLTLGSVVHDSAVAVGSERVIVASGTEISADYVVLAVGLAVPVPGEERRRRPNAALDEYSGAYNRLRHATRVLLVGAGAVGIELAGEIKAVWPETHVVLLDAVDDVLGDGSVLSSAPSCARSWRRLASSWCWANHFRAATHRGDGAPHVHRHDPDRPDDHRRKVVPVLRRQPGERLPR